MNTELQDLRDRWEYKAQAVEHFMVDNYLRVSVVTRENGYDVLRYFPLGQQWNVSCDLEAGSASDMLSTLNTALKS